MSRSARLGRVALGVALVTVAAAPAGTQSPGSEPFQLVRSLQALQDHMVRGSRRAYAEQKALLARMAEQFAVASPELWKTPRNARAAVTFALSGGDVRVVQKLVAGGVAFAIDEKLLKGALAYGESRREEAQQLLAGIDARTLDAGMAGHLAFVQAELAAQKEPAKALAHLDEARLLAPGTLIEEASLRRQIALLAGAGQADRYEALAAQYLRRFPHSVYAGGFRHQFAAGLALGADAHDPARLDVVHKMLGGIGSAERRDVYLTMAREALVKGKVAMARFASVNAARAAEPGSAEAARSRLYEGAALVATDDLDRGVELLGGADRSRLSKEDARLLDAALSVAGAVRRLPPPAAGVAPQGVADAGVLARARGLVAEVDQMLSGVGP